MELDHYIESGIIESVVLGLASATEIDELQQVRRLYPELNREIAAVEKRMEIAAFDEAVMPPTRLKERILHRINWQEEENGHNNKSSNYTFINMQPKGGSYITVHKWWKLFFIMVFIISKICLFSAIYYYLKYQQMQDMKQEKPLLNTEQHAPVQ